MKKHDIVAEVYQDLFSAGISILTLSNENLIQIAITSKNFNLDFDDAYQFLVAKENGLTLLTLDKNFKTIDIPVRYL